MIRPINITDILLHSAIAQNVECVVLIERLRRFISERDVCNYIGLSLSYLSKINSVTPSNEFKSEAERDEKYHLQKLKYFIDNGIHKPIDIDCLSVKGKHLPIPVILDGRHRYLAAILRKDQTIEATYSGREDLFKYLIGESNFQPR